MTRTMRLGDVIQIEYADEAVAGDSTYPLAGVYGFGRGVFTKNAIRGAETKYKTLRRLKMGQLIFSRLKAFEGAVAIVPEEADGCYVSHEFPTFSLSPEINGQYAAQIVQWDGFVDRMRMKSTGIGARRERLHPDDFCSIVVPLPELDEQRRISSHLDTLESASVQVRAANRASQVAMRSLTQQLIASQGDAPRVALANVLRLDRHWFEPQDGQSYDPVGVRGFGRGLIRYPPTPRAELPKLRFFRLHRDRLVVSNIKAWEGAVALTTQSDADRIGSNRFLMYESDTAKADLSYILGYLLSEEGLSQLQAGSPGSADRNRTLSISNFEAIEVPLPSIGAQRKVVRLLGARDRLAELVVEREKLGQALPASARNEIFSAMV